MYAIAFFLLCVLAVWHRVHTEKGKKKRKGMRNMYAISTEEMRSVVI